MENEIHLNIKGLENCLSSNRAGIRFATSKLRPENCGFPSTAKGNRGKSRKHEA